jgi:hypothetical protein
MMDAIGTLHCNLNCTFFASFRKSDCEVSNSRAIRYCAAPALKAPHEPHSPARRQRETQ